MAVNFSTLSGDSLTRPSTEVGGPSLDRSVERLSSGLRINRAADDAAGSAVSENANARLRSRQQAVKNINDGITVLQTADGGMAEISDLLIRVRELALQSSSGQYTDEQRGIMQAEVASLITAINQVTTACEFNGRYLLRGPVVDVVFLVDTSGSMGGELAQLHASLRDFRDTFSGAGISVRFGLVGSDDGGDRAVLLADVGDQDFVSVLESIVITGHGQDPYSMLYNASGINQTPGVYEPDAVTVRPGAVKHYIHVTDATREVAVPGIDPSEANLGSALAAAGITVDFICRPGHSSTYDGIAAATGGTVQSLGNSAGSNIPNAMDAIAQRVSATLEGNAESIVIHAGVNDGDRIDLGLPSDLTASSLGLNEIDVSTQDGAQQALPLLVSALEKLSDTRGRAAASMNTLEHHLSAQQHTIVGETAATGRVTDANYAEETIELARRQITAQGEGALRSQLNYLNRAIIETLLGK